MKKQTLSYTFIISTYFIPIITFAMSGVRGLLTDFSGVLNLITPLIFGLSTVYFFWGVAQFVLHDASNEKTREEGKKKIMWGIVALFVFASIYGILSAIGTAVDIPVPITP